MDPLQLLLQRTSNPRLQEPGPDRKAMEAIMQAALRAPDHGRLSPSRYKVFAGHGRVRLSALFVSDLLASRPDATEEEQSAAGKKPLRAPVVIAALCRVQQSPKVPAWEQWASTAAGVMQMMLAANALGYGAMWRTGAITDSPVLRGEWGLRDEDRIIGFLYVGTPAGEVRDFERPSPEGAVEWFDD